MLWMFSKLREYEELKIDYQLALDENTELKNNN